MLNVHTASEPMCKKHDTTIVQYTFEFVFNVSSHSMKLIIANMDCSYFSEMNTS